MNQGTWERQSLTWSSNLTQNQPDSESLTWSAKSNYNLGSDLTIFSFMLVYFDQLDISNQIDNRVGFGLVQLFHLIVKSTKTN